MTRPPTPTSSTEVEPFAKLPKRLLCRQDLTPSTKLVVAAIHDRMRQNPAAWPSLARIADDTGLSKRTAQRAVLAAERAGLIMVDRQPGGASYYTPPPHPRQNGTGTEGQQGSKGSATGDKMAPHPRQNGTGTGVNPRQNGTGTGDKMAPIIDSLNKTHLERLNSETQVTAGAHADSTAAEGARASDGDDDAGTTGSEVSHAEPVDALPLDELNRLIEQAKREAHPVVQKMWESADPRTDRTLRAAVNRLAKQEAGQVAEVVR